MLHLTVMDATKRVPPDCKWFFSRPSTIDHRLSFSYLSYVSPSVDGQALVDGSNACLRRSLFSIFSAVLFVSETDDSDTDFDSDSEYLFTFHFSLFTFHFTLYSLLFTLFTFLLSHHSFLISAVICSHLIFTVDFPDDPDTIA